MAGHDSAHSEHALADAERLAHRVERPEPAAGLARPGALRVLQVDRRLVLRLRRVVRALESVSLEIPRGATVGFVGPSGCGKSTLLKLIAGLLTTTNGRVVVDGQPVTGPLKNVGMAFQNPVLLPWRTVLDNVMLPVEVLGLERPLYRQRALGLLRLVGLQGFEDKYPMEMSGGMQQRAAITRALIHGYGLIDGRVVRETPARDALDDEIGNDLPASAPRFIAADRLFEGRFVLTGEWTEFRIARADYPDVDFRSLLEIRFEFGTPEGNAPGTTIYLDTIRWD